MGLDRATRIYALVVGAAVIALILLFTWQPSKVRDLNAKLAADPMLADYPYPFHVIRVEERTAIMGTPRSASMPVYRVLPAIDPSLRGVSSADPAFQQAQQALAEHQAHARAIVMTDPDIRAVRWELDEAWLRQHGVSLRLSPTGRVDKGGLTRTNRSPVQPGRFSLVLPRFHGFR